MGKAWVEKAGRQSNIDKVTVLRWAALGLPAGYMIHICVIFPTRPAWACMCWNCWSHLKTEPHFRAIFVSHNDKNEWQRSQSSSVIHILSPTKLSAVHSCCWEAPRRDIIRDINYNIFTQSLPRLVNHRSWFGCLVKALGYILCRFVFEKRLIFGAGRKLKQSLWQQRVQRETEMCKSFFPCKRGNLEVLLVDVGATVWFWTHNEGF